MSTNCKHDTDGDGNCHIHPRGCPVAGQDGGLRYDAQEGIYYTKTDSYVHLEAHEAVRRERDEARLSLQDINGDRAVLRELLQKAKAERDELKAEVDLLNSLLRAASDSREFNKQAADRLRTENAELVKDKARLDWLLDLIYRQGTDAVSDFDWTPELDDDGDPVSYILDRGAIDAAIAKHASEQG